MVLWLCSDYTAASSQKHADCWLWLLHSFQRLICQIHIWWAFTCWVHSYDSRNSFPWVSVHCNYMAIWESIWGGWVLIFHHSLNNMFAWKILYHTRVRWLVFEVLFLPTVDVIYCMCNLKQKQHITVYSVIWMCYLSLHNYAVSFVYMFVLLHAVKSNYNRIQILIVLCINCTMGAAILHDQVQQMKYGHYWRCRPTGGVELAWHGDIYTPTTFPGNTSHW